MCDLICTLSAPWISFGCHSGGLNARRLDCVCRRERRRRPRTGRTGDAGGGAFEVGQGCMRCNGCSNPRSRRSNGTNTGPASKGLMERFFAAIGALVAITSPFEFHVVDPGKDGLATRGWIIGWPAADIYFYRRCATSGLSMCAPILWFGVSGQTGRCISAADGLGPRQTVLASRVIKVIGARTEILRARDRQAGCPAKR